jgi:chitinase
MYATRRAAAVWGIVLSSLAACSLGSRPAEPAVAGTTEAEAVAPGAVGIYDDGLATGWLDWSWGNTRDLAATSPVASGTRSLAVTFQAFGGLYFRRSGASTAGTTTLQLSANGGAAAGSQFLIWAVQGSTNLASVRLASYCAGGTIPANAWTRCQVPLSALAPAGTVIDGIILQEVDGVARPTMYFDEVALTSSPAATPPPAGTPVVTVAISPATATVDACGTAKFGATVTGVADGSVGWTVQEGTAGGTVDGSGAYIAPSAAGTYHLIATSKASPSATATAAVVVRDRIISVAVVPGSASLAPSGTVKFAATVTTSCGSYLAVQ